MAKYMAIAHVWLTEPVPRVVAPGEVVELHRTPAGSGLFPLDHEARKAIEDAKPGGYTGAIWDRNVRRGIARLSLAQRSIIERAEREAAAA
jgi:hypothetical protein